jgi:hypothetical protein
VLNDFRKGKLRALVVSDVVARGLDVPDCDAGEARELLCDEQVHGRADSRFTGFTVLGAQGAWAL